VVSPGPWAVATDRAATPTPLGVHLARVVVPRGLGGVERVGTSQCEGACRGAGIACARAELLGVDSSGPRVEGRGIVVAPRPLGAHEGSVLRLCGLPRGMVEVRRTTRHGGALTPIEQIKGR
jgi:hypothetical protein